MTSTFDAILRSWPSVPWLVGTLILSAVIYFRGWRQLHRRDPERWHHGRLAAYLGGLLAIFLALGSPIEVFSSMLLQMHMLQHLLLIIVAPPLLWLGWPLFPMLRGLPEPIRTYWIAPLLRSKRLQAFFSWLTHPLVAWPVFVIVNWIWHLPLSYDLGLSNEYWHIVQHICFTASGLLFWFPVVRPYPSRPHWGQWLLFPYLILADVQNTVLAAWLTFSSKVLYQHYLKVPRLDGLTALDDQHAAGVIMWVPGSLVFLVPVFWIAVSYLMGSDQKSLARRRLQTQRNRATPTPPKQLTPAFNLLDLPGVGPAIRSLRTRQALQIILLLSAVLLMVDGFMGPQVAPMNLAGVVPWIHWRGVLILTLLVAGNFFCMACPFTLPRSLGRRWLLVKHHWPRRLRNKWLATGLVVLFLWSYEAFSLWDSPWLTAWIIIGYFVAAFVVESFFSGAAFCKYVCPIGQFNFVQSVMSPLEVRVKRTDVCASCTTMDCLRGNERHVGCGTNLLLPLKAGNFDCTFCLDCVRACPHDNVGLFPTVPAKTLLTDPRRAGIGRLSRRPDLAALVLVLVFGAFANAAGMIAPVLAWEDQLQTQVGISSRLIVTTVFYVVAIILLPLLAAGSAGLISRHWGRLSESTLVTATRFTFALIPIAFGMWMAHYTFHFFTSWEGIFPASQRFAMDHGWTGLGKPLWQYACCRPAAEWIPYAALLMLDVGFLASLYVGFRIAEASTSGAFNAVKAFSPWGVLICVLFVSGVWIVFQPMEMRGTLPSGTKISQNVSSMVHRPLSP